MKLNFGQIMSNYHYKYVPNVAWNILILKYFHYLFKKIKFECMSHVRVVFGAAEPGSPTCTSKDYVQVLKVSWRVLVSWLLSKFAHLDQAAGVRKRRWWWSGQRPRPLIGCWLLPRGAHELHAAVQPGPSFLNE